MNREIYTTTNSWEFEAEANKIIGIYYREEELESNSHYPLSRQILTIDKQLSPLVAFFPGLKVGNLSIPALGQFSEGHLVLPKFQLISGGYEEAVREVVDLLEKQRPNFINCHKDELNSRYLRLTARTMNAWELINQAPDSDYVILPVQLGNRHLGRSARRQNVLLDSNEFGLGPFEISIFLLTHPFWLSSNDDLGIDCVGAEYGPYKHGHFKYILFYHYLGSNLRLSDRWCGCPDKKFGPATGFLDKNIP